MIRVIWFLIQLGLIIAFALWLAENPGYVEIDWLDYTLNVHVGLFFVGMLVFLFLFLTVYSVLKTFFMLPSARRQRKEVTDRDKGYRALTLGLSALAAGDTKIASYQAQRALKFLPSKAGLPLLLDAQAARLRGDESAAHESFTALLENKDAAFLGVRGLLQTAIEQHRYDDAREMAKRALKSYPKQPWILKTLYDLDIKSALWDDAQNTLYRLEKAKGIDAESALSERLALWMVQAEDAFNQNDVSNAHSFSGRALKADKQFVPANSLLARIYIKKNEHSRAVKLIEKAWKLNPHEEYIGIWTDLMPDKTKDDAVARLRWYERLISLNTKSADGQLAAGRAAMHADLWGEARNYLSKAEEIRPSVSIFKARAHLEAKATGNADAEEKWLAKAADAQSDFSWVCQKTGRIYEYWHAIALPHKSFNTIRWSLPFGQAGQDVVLLSQKVDDLTIAPPFLSGPPNV